MGTKLRVGGLFVLSVLFLVGLLSATLVVGADRTVLDSDFTKSTLAEEDTYETVRAQGATAVEKELLNNSNRTGPLPVNATTVIEDGLSTTYLRTQAEANIDRLYAYFYGEQSELVFAVNTTPARTGIATAIEEQIVALSYADLFDRTDISGTFGKDVTDEIATMAANESAYENRSNTENFLLTKDDIDAIVNDSNLTDPDLRQGFRDIGYAYVEAKDPESDLTYTEYRTELDAAQQLVATGLGNATTNAVFSEFNQTAQFDVFTGDPPRSVELVRSGISTLSLLAILLPIAVLAIASLMLWTARTRSGGLWLVGGATLVVGIVLTGVASALIGELSTQIETVVTQADLPVDPTELVTGIFAQVLAVFRQQGLFLGGLGLVVIFVGGLIRQEILPIADVPGESTN